MRDHKTQTNQASKASGTRDDAPNSTESLISDFKKHDPRIYGWDDYFFFVPYLFKYAPELAIESLDNTALATAIHHLPCFFDARYFPDDLEIFDRIRWMMIARQTDDEETYMMMGGTMGVAS